MREIESTSLHVTMTPGADDMDYVYSGIETLCAHVNQQDQCIKKLKAQNKGLAARKKHYINELEVEVKQTIERLGRSNDQYEKMEVRLRREIREHILNFNAHKTSFDNRIAQDKTREALIKSLQKENEQLKKRTVVGVKTKDKTDNRIEELLESNTRLLTENIKLKNDYSEYRESLRNTRAKNQFRDDQVYDSEVKASRAETKAKMLRDLFVASIDYVKTMDADSLKSQVEYFIQSGTEELKRISDDTE